MTESCKPNRNGGTVAEHGGLDRVVNVSWAPPDNCPHSTRLTGKLAEKWRPFNICPLLKIESKY